VDQALGVARAGTIRAAQTPLLMAIYGAGFLAGQLVFVLLYALALNVRELALMRGNLRATGVTTRITLLSITVASTAATVIERSVMRVVRCDCYRAPACRCGPAQDAL